MMKSIEQLVGIHMKKLCDEIGPRATGSQANKAAVEYAAAVLESLGLQVIKQEFPCMDWKNNGARLMVNSIAVDAQAAEYSLPCDAKGPLAPVNTIEGLRSAELEGKICVLHGELCKEPLMPKSFTFWNPEEHREIIRLLEAKKPLAVIAVSFLPDVAVPIIQDGDFTIPCAAVAGEKRNSLLSGGQASLCLMTERRPSTAANVIATSGSGEKKVSFSAHIDTKPTTPGALDNASGVAALLALAARVAGSEYPYRMEFTLFNGEDYYSTPGETAFMGTYLQQPGNYACAFNVDGIGMKDSKTSCSFYECPESLVEHIRSFVQKQEGIEEIQP